LIESKRQMADFFTRTVPDEEDSVMGPAGTPIADRLRRAALYMTMINRNVWQDPGHTLLPWTRAIGLLARSGVPEVSNRMRRAAGMEPVQYTPAPEDNLAGRYVGPKDMIAHNVMPAYVPRQDFENAVRQDPLADWLGLMQKSVPVPVAE
jgi:hypothetical protein